MLIMGSCLALNLSNSGCCVWSLSQYYNNNECILSSNCHNSNNNYCYHDISNIGCHPASSSSLVVSPIPTVTFGKIISEASHFIYIIMYVAKQCCIQQCTFPPTPKTNCHKFMNLMM